MKVVRQTLLLGRVDLVDSQKQGLAAAKEQPCQLHIRRSELAAAIDEQDDGICFFQRHLCLAEDFRRNQLFLLRNDAAGIDRTQLPPPPLSVSVKPVAGDAGLIAHNGAS